MNFRVPALFRSRARVGLLSVALLFLLWYVATEILQLVPSLFFPSPSQVWFKLVDTRSSLAKHAILTLLRVLASFAGGSLLGVLVGLAMSRWRLLYAALEPLIELLRPVPPIALIPFFILWFGIGTSGKLVLAGLGCFMVMVIQTIEAVRNVPTRWINAALSLGATSSYSYRTVVVPAIVPELIAGARVALALAFALMIAAELMGAQAGLGYLIMVARRSLNTDVILLGILIVGFEAWICDRVLGVFTSHATKWTGRASPNP